MELCFNSQPSSVSSIKKEQAFLLSGKSTVSDDEETTEANTNELLRQTNGSNAAVIVADTKDFILLGLLQSKFVYVFSFLPAAAGIMIIAVQQISGFVLAVFFVFTAIFIKIWWLIAIAIVFLICMTVSVMMEHRNKGFFSASNTIMFSSGAFKRSKYYIKTDKIERISEKSFILKRKKGITTISLGFLGPLCVSDIKAKNLAIENFEDICKQLMRSGLNK